MDLPDLLSSAFLAPQKRRDVERRAELQAVRFRAPHRRRAGIRV
jgi:hypothetical protein